MYNGENSTSTLINCTFDNNESEHGGGLYASGGAILRVEHCVFQNNFSWSGGGAVMNEGANTVFIQCRFISNTASSYMGSAIDSHEDTVDSVVVNPVLEIDGCLFRDNIENYSGERAGALSLYQTQTTIKNSGFVNNTTTGTGSAIFSEGEEGTLDISNSYFYKNIATIDSDIVIEGCAVWCIDNQQVSLTNCTIVENEVITENPNNSFGGGIYSHNSPITITNCIIRDNFPDQVISGNPEATITYSNVTGISLSPVQNHNIDLPVYFAGGADLHLLPHDPNDETTRNPCIDAGNGDIAPATDFDGNPRRDDPQTPNNGSGTPGYVDIGAFEYQP
jgi:predicted outer membrane repeat protein